MANKQETFSATVNERQELALPYRPAMLGMAACLCSSE
jgi:hypothetical protein